MNRALGISVKETMCFEVCIVVVTNDLLLFAVDCILSFMLDFISLFSALQTLSYEADD